jgi:hypothetical protein
MKHYKHTITEDIAESVDSHYYRIGDSSNLIPKRFIENSNDWVEVIENKEWLVTTLAYKDGAVVNLFTQENLEYHLKKGCDVTQIYRLTDGEIFTIGDKIIGKSETICTIKKIWINPDCNTQILFNPEDEGISLMSAMKAKPIFLSEDKIPIYYGDKYWYVTPDFKLFSCTFAEESQKPINQCSGNYNNKIFSHVDEARTYIIMNKPCLSLVETKSFDMNGLTNLVKSRI